MPLAITLPENLRSVYASKKDGYLNMLNISIATQELEEAQGSCCDDGRYEVDKCQADRWFRCPEWGVRDTTPWLQFGPSGYTFATATVHKGSCRYHARKVLCPVQTDCTYRVPPRDPSGSGAPARRQDVCLDLPKITKLGMHHRPINEPY